MPFTQMALALALQHIDPTRRRIRRIYKGTFTGNYVTAGVTLDFTAQTNPNNIESSKWSRKPTGFAVENFPAGYRAEIVVGTLLTNWKVKIFDLSTGAELGNGAAIPAGITGSTSIRLSFSGPTGV